MDEQAGLARAKERAMEMFDQDLRVAFEEKWHRMARSGGIDTNEIIAMPFSFARVVLMLLADDQRLDATWKKRLKNLRHF